MARLPKLVVLPDGTIDLRLKIKPQLWALLKMVGSEHEALAEGFANGLDAGVFGARLLLTRLNDLVALGDVRAIPGPEWQPAMQRLRGDREAAESAFPAGFDRSVLHLDNKRKAGGYYGVYTYGPRFKARARHASGLGEVELGSSYKTAELAALDRYYYYLKTETLAYGEAEDEIMHLRRIDPSVANVPDAELWPQVVEHLQISGRYEEAFRASKAFLFPGPREPQLAARAKNEPMIDTSEWSKHRALVIAAADGVPSKQPEPEPELIADAPAPWSPPTWAGLAPEPEPVKRRGRPRVHFFQNGADSCACGKVWPCSRRDKSLDGV